MAKELLTEGVTQKSRDPMVKRELKTFSITGKVRQAPPQQEVKNNNDKK